MRSSWDEVERNDMDLIINFVETGKITLKLKRGQLVVDALDFSFHGNLDDLLIASVDKIFKRNRIEASSLKTIKVEGEVDKNSSAYKIAQTFVNAWKEAQMVGF